MDDLNKKSLSRNLDEINLDSIHPEESLVKPSLNDRKFKLLKKHKILLISILLLLILTATILILVFNQPKKESGNSQTETILEEQPTPPPKYYSVISGEEIGDPSLNSKPTFCIQIPNGLDGARPHVGLHEAKVVFEAIAEAGITRFSAIFQDPKSTAIGPIRSLRTYYTDWFTPFNCTLVHAGGSYEAIIDARNYRDLTESHTYMWRASGAWVNRRFLGYYAPNNLFTSASLLNQFNQDHGYTTSEPKGFTRLRPQSENPPNLESTQTKDDNATPTPQTLIKDIDLKFGHNANFNVHYSYNLETNSYFRSYASGEAHLSYTCLEGDKPAPQTNCGAATQINPKVVIALKVNEWIDTDGYHHAIQTAGSGQAFIFQNGQAIQATWHKSNRETQLTFTDASGQEIALTPGQVWVSAIPNAFGGNVSYY